MNRLRKRNLALTLARRRTLGRCSKRGSTGERVKYGIPDFFVLVACILLTGIPPIGMKNPNRMLSIGVFRDSVGIRTQDPQLRRLLLYPTELRNHPEKCANILKNPDNQSFFFSTVTIIQEWMARTMRRTACDPWESVAQSNPVSQLQA